MSLEQKNDWEQKIDIKSLELEELTEQLVQMGLPKFRGGQVYSWLHEKRVDSFEQMSNLSPKSICCAWRTTTAWKRF